VLIGSFFVGLVVGGFSGSYYTAEQFKRVRRYKGDGNDGSLSNNVPISEIKDLDTCLETIGDLETYHLGEYTNLLNNQQFLKDGEFICFIQNWVTMQYRRFLSAIYILIPHIIFNKCIIL